MWEDEGKLTMKTIPKIAAAALMVAVAVPPGAAAGLDTEAYARVLDSFVTADGGVRYAALEAESADLDRALAGFAAMTPAELEALPEADRIAFWINAYNAITLKTIIDNYPIQGSGLSALRYPSSSIRQISGAWSNRDWTVAGRKMSLDDIEHETLRKLFDEPRIHMALVCAAKGCPPLRTAPFRGDRLDEQLDDQARRYLASPAGLRVEPDGREVAVSAILKWFDDDFDSAGGVRAFLAAHAPAAARTALSDRNTKITYLDYDWSLNEARGD
jgi:hypothetical protein